MVTLINAIGILLIIFIICWFWLFKPKKVLAKDSIDIIVADGVYQPAVIKTKQGETLQLRFIRKDTSPCAQIVIFDQLNINRELFVNKPSTLVLNLTKVGEYNFTCQMGMYRGKLIVE